jgi:hypothetical protein
MKENEIAPENEAKDFTKDLENYFFDSSDYTKIKNPLVARLIREKNILVNYILSLYPEGELPEKAIKALLTANAIQRCSNCHYGVEGRCYNGQRYYAGGKIKPCGEIGEFKFWRARK